MFFPFHNTPRYFHVLIEPAYLFQVIGLKLTNVNKNSPISLVLQYYL